RGSWYFGINKGSREPPRIGTADARRMFPFHGTDTPVPAKAVAFKNCRLVIMRYVSYRVWLPEWRPFRTGAAASTPVPLHDPNSTSCAICAPHSHAIQIPPPSTPVVQ